MSCVRLVLAIELAALVLSAGPPAQAAPAAEPLRVLFGRAG